jgi:hypothetical protein
MKNQNCKTCKHVLRYIHITPKSVFLYRCIFMGIDYDWINKHSWCCKYSPDLRTKFITWLKNI